MSSIESRVAELEEQVKSLMEKLGTTKIKATKKQKSSTNKDGSPKKKRGTTGYLMFAKETRPEAKDFITTEENPNPKPTEVVTEIAKRWKALDDEERASWNEKAKVANEASDDEPMAETEEVVAEEEEKAEKAEKAKKPKKKEA